jgi:hypothetical protein
LELVHIQIKNGGYGYQKGGNILLKTFKLSVLFLMFVTFISCATQEKTIKNPKETSLGNIEWKSSQTPYYVTINNSYGFKFVGSKHLINQNRIYDYSVFTNQSGGIIYIIDWKNTTGEFPEGVDVFEPRDVVNSKDLLKYEPFQFTIWTGISRVSHQMLTEMGIAVPQCKVALNSGRLNADNRSTAVFVVFIEPWNCQRSEFEDIIDHYNDVIFIW